MIKGFMGSVVVAMFAAGAVQAQVLERIVAVVDDEMILQSQLEQQIQFFVLNNRIDPNTPGLREQVLQSMINEKLMVAKAIEDSVTVSEDEVTQQLDAVIRERIQAAGSEERLEQYYGMPISRIKREFRDEMRNSLLAQKLQQQRFGAMQIGRLEVEEFYRMYQDSLGEVPEEVELAHIMVKPKFDEAAKVEARKKMKVLIDSLKVGVPFEELARRHSQDPGSASLGGDLGLVRRGLFVKEFESAVFALKEGEISDVVETEFGLHIIQLLERRGDAVHPRHILLRIERTQASDDSAIALLNSLRRRILAGESFAELARKFSEDTETAIIGGTVGTVDVNQLRQYDRAYYEAVMAMKPGEVSEPVKVTSGSQYAYYIIWLKNRFPAHRPTLEQDYKRIENIALNFKRQKEYQAWIEELKKGIYWESRL
ncbi:MAG TPA: peptidylprolyl isomerase [Bacteroidota bacterium]|nr:peptidylprolyl isomerase [Bacteroidota bacterium]